LLNHIDNFVRSRVHNANLIADNKVAVAAISREEPDDLMRQWDEPNLARDALADVVAEMRVRHTGALGVECAVQSLAILRAQPSALSLKLLAVFTNPRALVVLPVFLGAPVDISVLVFRGRAVPFGITILLAVGSGTVVRAPPLLLFCCALTVWRALRLASPARLCPGCWGLRAIAALRLIPTRLVQFAS